jgi:hypothetical protein
MTDDLERLTVSVDRGPEADDEYLGELALRLRQYLAASDIAQVEIVRSGTLPAGAKGDPVSLATLAVTLAPATLTAFVTLLQNWLTRHNSASVTIESKGKKLTITGDLSRKQHQLVEAFLNRREVGET